MKKIKYIGALLLLLVICGCAKSDEVQRIEFEFKSNPTTGYEWSFSLSDDKILDKKLDNYVPDETYEDLVGVGGMHYYIFEAKESGKVTITFNYSRPFESGVKPYYELIYDLEINDNYEIKVLNSKEMYFEGEIPTLTISTIKRQSK